MRVADAEPAAEAGKASVRLTRWWGSGSGAPGSALRALLAPASWLYGTAMRTRNAAYDARVLAVHRAAVPVVSVGNLAVGGTGKTPVAAWLLDELCARGHRPALLHGGYAADEPALHRLWHPELPVIVERDRVFGAERAVADGATAVVLDDGFQHRRLARDVDLLLLSAETWTTRPRLLPRGPWREPLEAAERATLIGITRKTAAAARARMIADEMAGRTGRPVVQLALVPTGWRQPGGARGQPPGETLAVAALAQPELFAASARQAGARVGALLAYPDHHPYTPGDARRIVTAARGRPVITTEKDWVKLAGLLDDTEVWLLEQHVVVEDGAAPLADALDRLRA